MFAYSQIPEVTVSQVADDAYVLDVRDFDEWSAGHAPRAHHVPMAAVPSRVADVPRDRDVVVVCRVGARSAQVVAYLRAQGWDRASNLAGGMVAWQAGGRPIVSEDGSPARVL